LQFWQSVAFLDPEQLVAVAKASDGLGYRGITVSDHVIHPDQLESRYPYSPTGDPLWEATTPWPDPWVAIAAMAAVTTQLRFTTNIFVAPSRHPILLAKAVATAAVMSGNRVALGLSAGWMREEFDLLGQPFAGRGDRLDEMIDVMRSLWAGGMVEHHGDHYDFDRIQMSPAPSVPVPVYGGGHSDAALRRAARLDGWIGGAYSPDDAVAVVDRLQRLRAEAADRTGNSDGSYQIILGVLAWPDADLCRRMGAAGVTGLLCAPWMMGKPSAAAVKAGTEAALRESIERFAGSVVLPCADIEAQGGVRA
jgi:probable F420-dependent oxidoreductase